MSVRARCASCRVLFVACIALFFIAAGSVAAQDDAGGEPGVIVGTTGLNIRECPDVACPPRGLAQLEDSVTVTGPAENGYFPVTWKGIPGWAWGLYVATPSRGTPFLEQGTPGCDRLAIIFNIGIGEPVQLQPLRWLKEHKVPATVFPMGWWAQDFPDDMRTIAMLGFPIGSHGDVRINLTSDTDDEVVADVADSYAHIKQIIGADPIPYFTPYAADSDERVRSIIARMGYLPIAWDVPADDWDVGITADYVYNRVVPNVEDGSIIEFHLDGPSTAESTAVALPKIVKDLQAQGYQFVTIQDMAQPCGAPAPGSSTPVAAATASPQATP